MGNNTFKITGIFLFDISASVGPIGLDIPIGSMSTIDKAQFLTKGIPGLEIALDGKITVKDGKAVKREINYDWDNGWTTPEVEL